MDDSLPDFSFNDSPSLSSFRHNSSTKILSTPNAVNILIFKKHSFFFCTKVFIRLPLIYRLFFQLL